MPMMRGVWRACVLLPEQAPTWPQSQRRDVLLHELGHVRRWDCLSQLLSQVGCAVYWFNPLAWVAAKRMRIERERACDDLVLNSGSDSRAYAGAIFTLAGKATTGGVDLDLTIQVSASSDGGATITDKVTAPVIRNATLSHKGPAQPGKPFVVVSVDAGSVDKDGRAVAYIGRITLGALNESASKEMNRGDVGRTP